MYGLSDLKPIIGITASSVECPVLNCANNVARQRDTFKRETKFRCPEHRIFISPSTFEYPTMLDNLLWKASDDLELLDAILHVKRECRMARDNSEDALTWNVFRYLERTDQLGNCLSALCARDASHPQMIYWSYSQREHGPWSGLVQAREEFGEDPKQSSEPDLIVVTDKTLFIIEPKLTATNETTPSNPTATKKYLGGGNEWFKKVFRSEYQQVAIRAKKYEFMRFWLLGTWMAAYQERDFILVNLVPEARELEIEQEFNPHIKVGEERKFLRLTWEQLYEYIWLHNRREPKTRQMQNYFTNKTIGYDRWGRLKRAFALG